MDEQRLLQIEEGRKFAKVLKNTNVRPPSDKDIVSAYRTGNLPIIGDTVPCRNENLIRENTDYLYTETYILDTKKEIDPVVEQSIRYIETYGFTEQDFRDVLGIGYDPALVVETAMVLQVINKENAVDYAEHNIFPFINKAYAEDFWNDIANCTFNAVFGVDWEDIMNIETGYLYAAQKKIILKALGKAATRALGVIGAALDVYDLCSCMGWVYNECEPVIILENEYRNTLFS